MTDIRTRRGPVPPWRPGSTFGYNEAMEPTDRDLILGCRAGRTAAWKALLLRYERLVYSIPLRYGLSRDDAADVSQITFSILIDAIDNLPEDSRLGGWLATVARRHTWRLMERRRREGFGSVDHLEGAELAETAAALGAGDPDSIEHWELSRWLETGLESLGGRCQKLLEHLYFHPDEPSYEEVSTKLGIPVGSIGPTRARCLKRLRKLLEG